MCKRFIVVLLLLLAGALSAQNFAWDTRKWLSDQTGLGLSTSDSSRVLYYIQGPRADYDTLSFTGTPFSSFISRDASTVSCTGDLFVGGLLSGYGNITGTGTQLIRDFLKIAGDTITGLKRVRAGVCYMDSASGVVSADSVIVNKVIRGAANWRGAAIGGAECAKDTIAVAGIAAGDVFQACWAGATVPTAPLTVETATDTAYIYCAAADTAKLRAQGYTWWWLK